MSRDAAPPRRGSGRRTEYAQQTRLEVIDAARGLFARQGYFPTTVHEIAAASRVSVGTVYQQCGGKRGLLRTLMRMSLSAPLLQASVRGVESAIVGEAALKALTGAYFDTYAQFGDVLEFSTAAATCDGEAADFIREVHAAHRAVLTSVAPRLRTLDVIPVQLPDEHFVDVAMFYLGRHSGVRFLLGELGWEPQRARDWIARELGRSLRGATD